MPERFSLDICELLNNKLHCAWPLQNITLKIHIFFNPIFNPCFPGSLFFRFQVFQDLDPGSRSRPGFRNSLKKPIEVHFNRSKFFVLYFYDAYEVSLREKFSAKMRLIHAEQISLYNFTQLKTEQLFQNS